MNVAGERRSKFWSGRLLALALAGFIFGMLFFVNRLSYPTTMNVEEFKFREPTVGGFRMKGTIVSAEGFSENLKLTSADLDILPFMIFRDTTGEVEIYYDEKKNPMAGLIGKEVWIEGEFQRVFTQQESARRVTRVGLLRKVELASSNFQ